MLQNKVNSNIKTHVIPALIKAGLPIDSIKPFVAALAAGDTASLAKIPGVTPTILQTAVATFRDAYARSFKTVYLATIVFGGLSFIASFMVPNIDNKLSNDVVRRLGKNEHVESGSEVTKSMDEERRGVPLDEVRRPSEVVSSASQEVFFKSDK